MSGVHTDKTMDEDRRMNRQPKVKEGERDHFCEICGQRLERDPESGELFCPGCYDSEDRG